MDHQPRLRARLFGAAVLPLLTFGLGSMGPMTATANDNESGCQLDSANNQIQHVVYVQFDNTHFTRDNPNVPSDLEQMPNLLNFITDNGTLLANHHTPLISHTATDILTSFTGVYGDRHGVPVSNSFRYFTPTGTTSLGVSFAYWTDPIFDPTTSTPTDTTFNMLTAGGQNAPAPWVPYTRAGCNVGAVSTANIALENIATDIPTVFGANSAQALEVKNNPNQAFADFVGIGIHCAVTSSLCSSAHGGEPDLLPQEPGGYNGYLGLFGHKYVAPQISPSGPLTDLNGNVIMNPDSGTAGFPGFDGMSASRSLAYVASMLEHGVPVTYAYISDAHDNHAISKAMGPGQKEYVQQLSDYNTAFGKFFNRLAADGINKSNTLFVFTADEGDHFAGGAGTPAGCNGVTTPCTYPSPSIGEINTNMAGLLATQQGITTAFKVHADDAPTVYITGNPARDATVTRAFERATGKLTALNPRTGNTDTITTAMADPVEMKLLHMVTADPARTPTFTWFANPEYFLFAGAPNCNFPCVTVNPSFAWNHGTFNPEIVTTWLGMVGPGIRHEGVTRTVWSDHTDIRPTMLSLLGLTDDYAHQGRVLTEALQGWAIPKGLRGEAAKELGRIYKQINAPVGALGLASLKISTRALQSNAGGDATYASLESQLADITSQRDSLANQISALLEGAAFNGGSITERQAEGLIEQASNLLERVQELAGGGDNGNNGGGGDNGNNGGGN